MFRLGSQRLCLPSRENLPSSPLATCFNSLNLSICNIFILYLILYLIRWGIPRRKSCSIGLSSHSKFLQNGQCRPECTTLDDWRAKKPWIQHQVLVFYLLLSCYSLSDINHIVCSRVHQQTPTPFTIINPTSFPKFLYNITHTPCPIMPTSHTLQNSHIFS